MKPVVGSAESEIASKVSRREEAEEATLFERNLVDVETGLESRAS